jgi:hypothetical protein
MSKLSFKILGKKRKGGGGTSTSSTIPEWAEPYIKNVLNETERTYNSGALSGVSGINANQQAAFGGGAEMISRAGVEGTNTLDAQRARLANNAQTGGFLQRPMPSQITGAADGGLVGPATNPYLQAALNQEGRLGTHATSGGYDPQGVVDAAVLEGGMRTADMGRQYGQAGTLGSARQGVQQASQNAATTAAVAGIRQGAAQQNFQNKMAAEGMMGSNLTQQLGISQQDFQQRMASEGMLGQNVAGTSQLAGNTASGLANLGNQQRTAVQQQLDSPYQALQRYATTAYGNPARQQTVASGGK